MVLAPFGKLASYPEKLSKNEMADKIPETKNRIFGRFVWGINMLSDNLENKKRRINELSREHLTMMTTIAHGIKTPVANIKLYADAISTGLYQPDGMINEKDAEVAAKISKNADDVTELVKELIEKASGGIVDYEAQIEPFYLKELEDFLKEQFVLRLEVLRIPFSIELGNNTIIKSDKNGIAGSGIGLFEAREIARKLYGDIYVKTDRERGEIEFDVYLPDGSSSREEI